MFVLSTFKELIDLNEMHEYASKNLSVLFEFRHRKIYGLDDNTVLKIANDDDGALENLNEFRISSSHNFENVFPKNIITKAFEKDSMSLWMTSERCEPISKEEFSGKISMEFDKFAFFLRELTMLEEFPPEEIQKTIDFIKSLGIIPSSIAFLENWGKNGQDIKLIDFGSCRNDFQKRPKKYTSENSKPVYFGYGF